MVLKVDLINAYNMCDRDSAFKVVEDVFPDCLKWVLSCYGMDAVLIFGDTIILSSCGFHQGDPLAFLLFSLTLQPIVEKIQQVIPDLEANVWYLDDGALAGTREQLQRAVDIILQDGPARGLFLSTAATISPPSKPKSTVWSPHDRSDDDDPMERGIPRVQTDGIVLLGSPIGSREFAEQTIRKRITKINETTNKLLLLQDAHSEYVLLRSWLSLQKIMFTLRSAQGEHDLLRTSDPTDHQSLWKEFDSITREALIRIISVPVDNSQWKQAQLPVSVGGLGLRSAWDHAPAA
jgi:hypothetical protein